VLAAAPIRAVEQLTIVVEDWSSQPAGKTGIPEGWTGHRWGSPRYDFTVVVEGPDKVLRLRSQGDNSTISKEVAVDIKRFPILVWRWKVARLPTGGDSRRRETDDQAAQVYVTFPRFPEKLRSRIVGYVWDATAPSGTIVKSPSAGAVTYVVARSGEADLGGWWTETRNVYDDYRRIYGEGAARDGEGRVGGDRLQRHSIQRRVPYRSDLLPQALTDAAGCFGPHARGPRNGEGPGVQFSPVGSGRPQEAR
jgi:Protein of unknown function (DUF3047)